MFKINASQILRLAEINHFPLSKNNVSFFGFRGLLPANDDSINFKDEHLVVLIPYDHVHPRCTIGQYHPDKGIALFPASTVPHKQYIKSSLQHGGNGANMLITGFYKDYRKGWHKAGNPSGHEAFRQDNKLPVRRTADDLDYDYDDRVEYMRPYDNLHAAWCMGPDHDFFTSAGCQVIVGYPKCQSRNNAPDTGPWKTFKDNAYTLEQNSFDYMLLHGHDANKVSGNPGEKLSSRLRFGSEGNLVGKTQEKLKDLNYYEGNIDNDFGPRTLRALLEFQTRYFGENADDGIVGPMTASALGIPWD